VQFYVGFFRILALFETDTLFDHKNGLESSWLGTVLYSM
jgi:hypothetical protein